ncbi:hypothetical protein HU749_020535 [Pseudomonas ogarae]|nr:hypothetical protein HU749_020535 [Pseudomonas zarinae]
MVVNEVTGEVTQVSDTNPEWITDGRIKWK